MAVALGAARRRPLTDDDGAQALEFVMTLPLVLLVLTLVVQAGLLGAELVHVHGLAREAARVAAVAGDAAARTATARAAGDRAVAVTLEPPEGARHRGEHVTAHVRLESRAFGPLAPALELDARATMRVEAP